MIRPGLDTDSHRLVELLERFAREVKACQYARLSGHEPASRPPVRQHCRRRRDVVPGVILLKRRSDYRPQLRLCQREVKPFFPVETVSGEFALSLGVIRRDLDDASGTGANGVAWPRSRPFAAIARRARDAISSGHRVMRCCFAPAKQAPSAASSLHERADHFRIGRYEKSVRCPHGVAIAGFPTSSPR